MTLVMRLNYQLRKWIMEKVEQYIQEYTKNCSNLNKTVYQPWLTPYQARAVAKIAREETIKEVRELFDGMDLQDIKGCTASIWINKLKNYLWYLEKGLPHSSVIASVTKDSVKGFIVELKLMNQDGRTSPSISLVFENIEELDALANGIVALAKEVKEQE